MDDKIDIIKDLLEILVLILTAQQLIKKDKRKTSPRGENNRLYPNGVYLLYHITD